MSVIKYPETDTVAHAGLLLQHARARRGVRRLGVPQGNLRTLYATYTDGSIDRFTWADHTVLVDWLKARRSWYGTTVIYGNLQPRVLSRTFINRLSI